ncbi:hypothetical protein TNCV_1016101 [Trichonephila clavipes]|uniref:Uncharacterized protein n=1 Tax=Trichonephila clavipes TaxID=2585209 RepID=A0A8X6VY53_TRICX|nr:hypothetical protein TNCV_1016101 [Trichonephila clavipes]
MLRGKHLPNPTMGGKGGRGPQQGGRGRRDSGLTTSNTILRHIGNMFGSYLNTGINRSVLKLGGHFLRKDRTYKRRTVGHLIIYNPTYLARKKRTEFHPQEFVYKVKPLKGYDLKVNYTRNYSLSKKGLDGILKKLGGGYDIPYARNTGLKMRDGIR